MCDEKFFSGYCRQVDGSRTVTVELEDGAIDCVDCCYPECVYSPNCPIAREIDKLIK